MWHIICKLCHRIHDFCVLSTVSRFMRVSREKRAIWTFQLHFSTLLSLLIVGKVAFACDVNRLLQNHWFDGTAAWIATTAELYSIYSVLSFHSKFCNVKNIKLCKNIQFYSYSLRLHQQSSRMKGSRLRNSLFIDLKVEILACNVKPLEANSKCIQVLLQQAVVKWELCQCVNQLTP